MTQLIKTASLTGFYELVTRLGGDPDALLRQFNIDAEKVRSLEGVLPFGAAVKVVEAAAEQLDCPDFGLRLARQQDLTILGPLAALALNAPTVGDALRATINCLHYYTGGLKVALRADRPAGRHYLSIETSEGRPLPSQNRELALGFAHRALRVLCGEDFRPQAVLLQGDEPLHDAYYAFFGAPVHFAQDLDALVLSAEQLEHRIAHNDTRLHQFLNEYIGEALREQPMDLKNQVEQLIFRLMPIQRCSLQEVANQLGLHKRTLQRRLSDQSIVFEALLDRIRREHTKKYLLEPEMPMTQVAALLGYREQSSFNRACQRWFGMTPLKMRRQLQSKAAAAAANPLEGTFEP